ncbi:hypothetical protein SODALDRAFT_381841 [Sodiomyces alkalinus F11]|uniref:Uncharacterized protein n=1 Tax=Sodiomyces alkalinus (strain CBS 110278 / VKM F-3762 / F11) TaxID=1314773 RepID=A0A3N2PK11_SODAK|nr:hypothetical protein SODALDRAFT_381841 [Sodiomyces alkalinus F11]ROT34865.1 hypothetical protein SODALDRAFT_381841 [Sodiomyces alkalinus F11]
MATLEAQDDRTPPKGGDGLPAHEHVHGRNMLGDSVTQFRIDEDKIDGPQRYKKPAKKAPPTYCKKNDEHIIHPPPNTGQQASEILDSRHIGHGKWADEEISVGRVTPSVAQKCVPATPFPGGVEIEANASSLFESVTLLRTPERNLGEGG